MRDSTTQGGQQPNSATYHGPSCPAFCGNCYKVTNDDTGKSVTVKIVDACPALSAYNYCKSNTEPAGKCSGPKNALVSILFLFLLPGLNILFGCGSINLFLWFMEGKAMLLTGFCKIGYFRPRIPQAGE